MNIISSIKHLLNILKKSVSKTHFYLKKLWYTDMAKHTHTHTHTHPHTHTHTHARTHARTNTRDVLVIFTKIVGSNDITESFQCIEKTNPIHWLQYKY